MEGRRSDMMMIMALAWGMGESNSKCPAVGLEGKVEQWKCLSINLY